MWILFSYNSQPDNSECDDVSNMHIYSRAVREKLTIVVCYIMIIVFE